MSGTNDPVSDAVAPVADDLLGGLDLSGEDDAPVEAKEAEEGGGVETTEEAAETLENKGEEAGGEVEPEATPEPVVEKKPEPVAATPVPAPVTPPPPAPEQSDADRAFWDKYTAVTARLATGDVSMLDLTNAEQAVIAQGTIKVREQLASQQQAMAVQQQEREHAKRVEATWNKWGEEHKDVGGRAKGEAIFAESIATFKRDYPHASDETLVTMATHELKNRVALIRAQQAAKVKAAPATSNNPAKVATPATPKAATRVTPAGGVAKPKPASESPEDEFARTYGGSLKDAW